MNCIEVMLVKKLLQKWAYVNKLDWANIYTDHTDVCQGMGVYLSRISGIPIVKIHILLGLLSLKYLLMSRISHSKICIIQHKKNFNW